MTFEPLLIDEDATKERYANADCRQLFKSYPAYYYKAGYHPPWIAYLAIRENKVVGAGGFTGKPEDGKVEIAYWTFSKYEGQGIASAICRYLVSVAKQADAAIMITAKTSPEMNASARLLKRNGFTFSGVVQDEGIGDAWFWIFDEKNVA